MGNKQEKRLRGHSEYIPASDRTKNIEYKPVSESDKVIITLFLSFVSLIFVEICLFDSLAPFEQVFKILMMTMMTHRTGIGLPSLDKIALVDNR